MKKIKWIVLILVAIVLKIDNISADNIYEEYEVGDKIIYKDMEFYVIENSDKEQDYVTLLKSELLTIDEVNKYGVDENGITHVNRNIDLIGGGSQGGAAVGVAYNINNSGYGGLAYFSDEICGASSSGCSTEYLQSKLDYVNSDVKYIVDNWGADKLNIEDLKEDKLGYKIRLITKEEIPVDSYNKLDWMYNSRYWTMSRSKHLNDVYINVYYMTEYGLDSGSSSNFSMGVRPVINLKKDPIASRKQLTDKEFKIGDMITYNDIDFYVIEDSGKDKGYVTLLKAEPLTYEELSDYGEDGVCNFGNGYSGMPYYQRDSSDVDIECGDPKNKYNEKCCTVGAISGCKSDYESSDIKKVVDTWKVDKLNEMDLIEDSTGYKVRLLTKTELIDNFNFVEREYDNKISYKFSSLTPYFVVNEKYQYWIMNPVITDTELTMGVSVSGSALFGGEAYTFGCGVVRPVISLKKVNSDVREETKIDKNNKEIVSVPDTFLEKSVIIIAIGLLLIITGIVVSYILIKKKKFTKNE